MLATMPVWSALLGRVIGERLARRQVVGVGFSVAGIALAFLDPGRAVGGDAMSLVGDGLLLLTGLLGALYGLIAKRVLAVDHAATVTTYAMLIGAVILLPAALVEGLVPAIERLDGRLLGVVVFLGVLGGAAAFMLWTWALSRLMPTQVAVYVNLNQELRPARPRPGRRGPAARACSSGGAGAVVEALAADVGRLGWGGGGATLGRRPVVDGGGSGALASHGVGFGAVPVGGAGADTVDGGFGAVAFGHGVDPVALCTLQLLAGAGQLLVEVGVLALQLVDPALGVAASGPELLAPRAPRPGGPDGEEEEQGDQEAERRGQDQQLSLGELAERPVE
jgi:hypothetical protein